MAGRGVFLTAAIVLACAGKPAAQQAAAIPDEPPPRGAPQPRLGALPPPPPARASETVDENERRFPIMEHQLRKERQKRAGMQVTGRVEVKSDNPHACDGLQAEEKIECPLRDPHAVLSISDLPRGVRVSLRTGTVAPEKLQQLFACHASLAVARPKTSGACAFLDARTEAEVTARDGHVDVDLERASEADKLRQQVRAALGARK
jgi:hypothetical protein